MKRKIYLGSCLILLFSAERSFAQTNLYVVPGASFYIAPATVVALDSLVLIPSAGYTIMGENYQQRSSALLHTSFNQHITRVYRWQNQMPAFTGILQHYYHDGELNNLSEAALTLNVHNGSSWTAYTPVLRDGAANFVSTSLSNVVINELTLAAANQSLPMRWIHAEAYNSNHRNQVRWITADETNCKDYVVERTLNGASWEIVDAPVPARNTTGPNIYNLTDPSIPSNRSWYRIRQNDLDGHFHYSVILAVYLNNGITVQLHPNPASDQFAISATGRLLHTIQLYNAAGSLVYTASINGTSHYTVKVSSFAAGVYRAVIKFDDGSITTKTFIRN